MEGALRVLLRVGVYLTVDAYKGRVPVRRAYCFGGGALWAKHLRWRATGTARAFLRVGRGWALGHSRVAASLGRRAARGRRLVWFARGFLAGACTPIDRATSHYATRRS